MRSAINFPRSAAWAAVGLVGALGALASAGYANTTDAAPESRSAQEAYCEVLASPAGAGLTLQAIFHADRQVAGTYQFIVQSTAGSNRTSINQGGAFSADGAGVVPLGTVSVGSNGRYDIVLTIDAAGKTYSCGGAY